MNKDLANVRAQPREREKEAEEFQCNLSSSLLKRDVIEWSISCYIINIYSNSSWAVNEIHCVLTNSMCQINFVLFVFPAA